MQNKFKKNKRHKKKTRRVAIPVTLLSTVVVFCLLMACGIFIYHKILDRQSGDVTVLETNVFLDGTVISDVLGTLQAEELTASEAEETAFDQESLDEERIYSFSQGPKGWENDIPWAGSWCRKELNGMYFSVFGCGMCCIANIYGTLSPYECDPLDAYRYAKKASDYAPSYGAGAISWKDMKKTLKKMGFSCKLYKKDKKFKSFRKKVEKAACVLVLVSSREDDSFWKDTSGHYVDIWKYDGEDKTVFLSDPGDPDRNRVRLKLKKVYKALKTSSDYQYLVVSGYDEEENQWKYSGMDEEWIVPEYYVKKDATVEQEKKRKEEEKKKEADASSK